MYNTLPYLCNVNYRTFVIGCHYGIETSIFGYSMRDVKGDESEVGGQLETIRVSQRGTVFEP